MEPSEIRKKIEQALFDIAPDLEGTELKEESNFRDCYDIDSADYLNFMIRIHEIFGIDIPESDYPKMQTLGSAVKYLAMHELSKKNSP